jgi:transposase
MKADERIAHLEAEIKSLQEQLAEALKKIQELEGRLVKDSHNSSKPPSSDGYRHRTRSQREPSAKPSGGQPGHQGHTLMLVEQPDEVVTHRPQACEQCQQPLEGVRGKVVERRQVLDLPPWRVEVKEHQVEEVACPHCQQRTRGSFPAEVSVPVQYGAQIRALAVYWQQYQLVPSARTCEALRDLCGAEISEGTLARWAEQASAVLEPTIARIAEYVRRGPLQHADETGVRLGGKMQWLHVNSTRFLTHLAWHPKRGSEALEAIGIWPQFQGRAMRDRWASYDRYDCEMSLCLAHLLRELTYLDEQQQQEWAGALKEVLLGMHAASHEWRVRGARHMPEVERDEWLAQYFEILARGFASQPLPSVEEVPKRRGRRKQTPAKNLLDDLLTRSHQILVFLDDLSLPLTNNQAERDLRMVKVQQKISGTFRSEVGLTTFCRIRSYLSTMRKQGHSMLLALAAVFSGHPLPIAWSAE